MGFRVDVQAKLIALFKVNTFETVKYDANGIPSVGHGTEIPTIVCNEISSGITPGSGSSTTYNLTGWIFDLICSFTTEVDFSNFIESLENMTYNIDNRHRAEITLGSNVGIQHPTREGAQNGTDLRFNISVNIKK